MSPALVIGRRRPRRAYTLLEVLVAIALGLALLGALFAFYWDVLAARDSLLGSIEERRGVTLLVEGLERDLMTSMVGDGMLGAGIAGDETSVRVLARAVPLRLASDGSDAFSDLERTEYRFENGAITARRALAVGGDAGSAAETLGHVDRVRFRFHDGTAWRESFDSLRADALPVAIEIAVWFDLPEDENALGADGADGAEDDAPAFLPPAEGLFDEPDLMDAGPLEDDPDEPAPDRVRVIVIPDARDADATADEEGAA